MSRSEIEPLIIGLVRGAKNADGVDEALVDACWEGRARSLFFAPALKPLLGLGSAIEALLNAEPIEGAPRVTRQLITRVAMAREPSALDSILAVPAAVKAIKGAGHHSAGAKRLAEKLAASFPDPEVLSAGSIIHSMHAPDPEALKQLRERLGGKPLLDFSRDLMAGAFKNIRHEQAFYGHLENGYPVNSHHKAGRYKLTPMAARLLWKRLETMAEQKFRIEPFEVFAPIDVSAGPRNGQISRGLRVDWGNLTS